MAPMTAAQRRDMVTTLRQVSIEQRETTFRNIATMFLGVSEDELQNEWAHVLRAFAADNRRDVLSQIIQARSLHLHAMTCKVQARLCNGRLGM